MVVEADTQRPRMKERDEATNDDWRIESRGGEGGRKSLDISWHKRANRQEQGGVALFPSIVYRPGGAFSYSNSLTLGEKMSYFFYFIIAKYKKEAKSKRFVSLQKVLPLKHLLLLSKCRPGKLWLAWDSFKIY